MRLLPTFVVVVMAVTLSVRPVAHAAPPEAQRAEARGHVARGEQQYAAGHFPEAAAEFAQAHALDAQPAYLYRWAQAERRAGNCPVAVQLYRRYLRHELPAENVEAAQKNLARCGHAEPVDPPPATVLDASSGPQPRGEVEYDRRPPWWQDPAGVSLVAIGTAGLAAGGVIGGVAQAHRQRAADATVEERYADHEQRFESLRTAAVVTAAVGAALVVGGVIRWAVVARRSRRPGQATAFRPLQIRF